LYRISAATLPPAARCPEATMRNVYIALVVLFTGLVLLFNIQNLQVVTVSFLTLSVTLPVSLIVIITYLLGMATGGALLTVLRSWIRRARRSSATQGNDDPEQP
jgi:lipopolysaccharide assembly protein A